MTEIYKNVVQWSKEETNTLSVAGSFRESQIKFDNDQRKVMLYEEIQQEQQTK